MPSSSFNHHGRRSGDGAFGRGALFVALACWGASWLATPSAASADTLHLKSGKTLQGLSRDDPKDPDKVLVLTHMGELSFSREQIVKIDKLPEHKSRVELGDAYLKKGDQERGFAQIRQAHALAPDDPDVKAAMKRLEALLAKQEEAQRHENRRKLDTNLAKLRDLIEEKQFAPAAALLEECMPLEPAEEQALTLSRLRVELHYRWATDRLDRVDALGAMKHLEIATRLDPNHKEALKLLVELYETDQTNTNNVIEYWKKIADLEPKNHTAKLKVADAFYLKKDRVGALEYYLAAVLANPAYRGGGVETKLRDCFDEAHQEAARKGDYELAIARYEKYMEVFTGVDPEQLKRYQYAKKLYALKNDDWDGLVALAGWARQQGLDEDAEELYLRIFRIDRENKAAQEGLRSYANRLLESAQQAFEQKNYLSALNFADEAMNKYSLIPGVLDQAKDLTEKARIEYGRQQRDKLKQAEDYLALGEEYFAHGMTFMNQVGNADYKSGSRSFINPRQEATRYFQRAVVQYRKAAALDPQVGAKSDLTGKIDEAERYIKRLQGSPISHPRFYRPRTRQGR